MEPIYDRTTCWRYSSLLCKWPIQKKCFTYIGAPPPSLRRGWGVLMLATDSVCSNFWTTFQIALSKVNVVRQKIISVTIFVKVFRSEYLGCLWQIQWRVKNILDCNVEIQIESPFVTVLTCLYYERQNSPKTNRLSLMWPLISPFFGHIRWDKKYSLVTLCSLEVRRTYLIANLTKKIKV